MRVFLRLNVIYEYGYFISLFSLHAFGWLKYGKERAATDEFQYDNSACLPEV